jgi:hypothetical protein
MLPNTQLDYIRTFTWDKRLENWMKDLGGAGKEPTIVTPKQYKQRFRSAMERYFPLVSNILVHCWLCTHQSTASRQVDEARGYY